MNESRTTHHSTAKEFFLYLGSAVALYASAISLLNLLFDVINAHFPDALDYGFDPFSSSIRLAIATLVILFPLYLVLMRVINTAFAKSDSAIRKWLTYVTLFLAGVAVVTDLVVLINTFLGGEVTARFIWKVIAVLVVALAVFGYYYYDLKNIWQANRTRARIIAIAASLFVIASVVLAFMVVGSPKTQRLMRIDNQKTSDLQQIQWQVINYWQQKGKLPESLALLNDPISSFMLPEDPESNLGKMYTYKTTGKTSFEICADFNLPTPTTGTPITGGAKPLGGVAYDTSYPSMRGIDENWEHSAGVQCFDRTIDPELYPVVKK